MAALYAFNAFSTIWSYADLVIFLLSKAFLAITISLQRKYLEMVFIRALCESINMGRTSYTEAYRLTNTSRKTFSEVADRLGGAEW